jgi:hypothetical protein
MTKITAAAVLAFIAIVPSPFVPSTPDGTKFQWTTSPIKSYPSGTDGLAVTDACGNGFSSWTQLIASTPDKWTLEGLTVDAPAESSIWIQVGVGGAGAEAVIASAAHVPEATSPGNLYFGPLVDRIPAGSRVSIRFQDFYSLCGGATWRFKLLYHEGTMDGNNVVLTSGDWGWALVNQGCGNGVYGSWSQIDPAISADWYVINGTHQDATNIGAWNVLSQIGTGAAAAETPVMTMHKRANWSATGDAGWNDYQWPMRRIPSGSRVSIRCMGSFGRSLWHGFVIVTNVSDDITGLYTNQAQQIAGGLNSTSVAGGGAGYTPGVWTEFIPSTSNPIALTGLWQPGSCTFGHFEFGVGGAGAEVVRTSVRTTDRNCSGQATMTWYPMVPAHSIPTASQRISVRLSSNVAGSASASIGYIENPDFFVTTERQRQFPFGSVDITPNGTAWANSGYAELVSAASNTTVALITGVALYPNGIDGTETEIDIATGGAGSETVIATVALMAGSGRNTVNFRSALKVPAGVRLSARMRKAGTSTSAQPVVITYYADDPPGILTGGSSWLRNPVRFCCDWMVQKPARPQVSTR